MKKLIAVTLGLLMLLTPAACGGKTEPEKTDAPEAVLAEETTAPAPAEEDEGAPAGTDADWPFDIAGPEGCTVDEIEDWGSTAKVYVVWDSKDAAKAYKEALGLSGGTEADIDGAYEYTGSKVMISWSESNELANFINITK